MKRGAADCGEHRRVAGAIKSQLGIAFDYAINPLVIKLFQQLPGASLPTRFHQAFHEPQC